MAIIFERIVQDLKKLIIRSHSFLAPLLPDNHYPYPFKGGRIYLNIKEYPTMLRRALGVFEVEKTKAISSLLNSGMTFVDVGTNKGYFALLAARIVGKTGLVISFEPEPTNCKWIRRSIELNGYNNINLYQLALGDENEQTKLFLGKKSGWHSLRPSLPNSTGAFIEVQKRTLDSIVEEIDHRRIDVIKIDVEGAEQDVLRGAFKTLSTNRSIVLFMDLHPQFGIDLAEVYDFLKDLDFSVYEIGKPCDELSIIGEHTTEILAARGDYGPLTK